MSDDICGHIKNDGEKCTYGAKYPDGKCGHHTKHNESSGKQSKLEKHPEIIGLIGDEIERGATISEALSEAEQKSGVTVAKSTHDNWMAQGKRPDSDGIYAEYRSEVTRARNIAARSDRRELIHECREKGDTRTWWKVHQQQYADLYAGESGGGEETTVVIHDNEQSYRDELEH